MTSRASDRFSDSCDGLMAQRICELQAIAPQGLPIVGTLQKTEDGLFRALFRARSVGGGLVSVATDQDAQVAVNRATDIIKHQIQRRAVSSHAKAA